MNGNFSSADFGKTKSSIQMRMPAKLIHKQVEKSGTDVQFSEERKHPVQVVDLPSTAISVTLGGLLPGQHTNQHRHTYETIIYVLKGSGYTMVEDHRVDWQAGDAIYIPLWAWHQHFNASQFEEAKYIACENAPMLQNIGLGLREERETL